MDRIAHDTHEGVQSVRLLGEHDYGTVSAVDAALARAFAAEDARVLLDLTETTFIDSAIIAAMIRWSREAQLSDRQALAIATGPPGSVVVRALALVDLVARLPCFASVTAARGALAEGAKARAERALEKMTDPELGRAGRDAVDEVRTAASRPIRDAAGIRLGDIVREQTRRRGG